MTVNENTDTVTDLDIWWNCEKSVGDHDSFCRKDKGPFCMSKKIKYGRKRNKFPHRIALGTDAMPER